ncbi:anaerobic ribonucleoside-triphosphate reductase activating protein, partial [Candidatus Gracilibacteria bacterium]|nr:anaerobic ribonucleoside-triphosphate reductase activating protein [Candidatus Gracilibacteria bacterium]
MQIAGIKKTSLLDYPGKIATIIFTLGCNFRCHYCHNPDFVLPEKIKLIKDDLITEKAFFNFLEKRVGFIDGVVITGGEPTLQKDLYEFIKKIKKMGFLIKLDSNGRDPKILKRLIKNKLVDYIAMDIKNPIKKYKKIVNINLNLPAYEESIKIILNSDIDHEFRTTVVSGHHTKKDIENIGKLISGAKAYYIQNYESKINLNPKF